ncbi:MAG: GTPase Obg [Chloroflexi bacterium]|nr:GTPase Obg [Chloroflexota bacterium]
MPTNLPADYYNAQERFRSATTTADKITYLNEMMSTIPKHKGTDHLRADLRKKLSKLKGAEQSKKGTKRHVSAYHIDKEGAGQIAVIGPPNAGKSSLLNAVTNATPEVSPAPFTTWNPTPGMMLIDNVQVQLIDTPPLSDEYINPEFLNLLRRVDMLLVMIDLQANPVEQLHEAFDLLQEHRIAPQHLQGKLESEGYLLYVPCLVLVNKHDGEEAADYYQIFQELLDVDCPLLPISTETAYNIDKMKETIFDWLGIVRVYSQTSGAEPDFSAPFVVYKGCTVEEFAGKIHKDFLETLKTARVWGESADFEGQMVSREHVLQDGDVVELVK